MYSFKIIRGGKVLILSTKSKTYDYLSDFGYLWNA